jgi:hypothetical protein
MRPFVECAFEHGKASAELVSRMVSRVEAAVGFVDGLNDNACAPDQPNVMAPARRRLVDRRATALSSSNELIDRPCRAPVKGERAGYFVGVIK